MLSVVVPSYKDPLLLNTIQDVLKNSVGEIEIIPVIDGYDCQIDLGFDSRIRPIVLKENKGMRNAINVGVNAARGDYLMRSDEHCAFGPEFDNIILENIEDNWIVLPVRYKLNIETWQRESGPIFYEKLIIVSSSGYGKKFASYRWKERDKLRKDFLIDETMAMQGSCWFMSKKHWKDVIGRLDDKLYGTLYQDSVEMTFKTWVTGGKLMLNKNTWYAHKARRFKRPHHFSASKAKPSFEAAINIWGDYYKTIMKNWM